MSIGDIANDVEDNAAYQIRHARHDKAYGFQDVEFVHISEIFY